MFINTTTLEYPLTKEQIISRHPNISFGQPFIAPAEYALVEATAFPDYDADEQKVVESAPTLVNGTWKQNWSIVALSNDEKDFRNSLALSSIPREVTMRQARLALLQAGLLSQVQTAIDAMPSPQKEAAQIEWEYSSTMKRDNPFVAQISAALNLTEAQLNQLFITASTL